MKNHTLQCKNVCDILKMMTSTTLLKTKKDSKFETLRTKAAIFDELVELIEEKYFGYLMNVAEKEKNIPLSLAKKLLN